jgi:hypothetical protein
LWALIAAVLSSVNACVGKSTPHIFNTNDYVDAKREMLNPKVNVEYHGWIGTNGFGHTILSPIVCSSLWYTWDQHLLQQLSACATTSQRVVSASGPVAPCAPDWGIDVGSEMQILYFGCGEGGFIINRYAVSITGSIARSINDAVTNTVALGTVCGGSASPGLHKK